MSWLRSRETNLAIALIGAAVIWAYSFFGLFSGIAGLFKGILTFVGSFAVAVGLYRMTMQHIHIINIRSKDRWMYSLLMLVSFYIMLILGFIPPMGRHWIFELVYYRVGVPISSAFSSIIAFFYFTASWRAFKIKNVDSLILGIAAVIMIMRNSPAGALVWKGFPVLGDWLINIPTSGTFRGVVIGMGIGALSMIIRTLAGKERAFLGTED